MSTLAHELAERIVAMHYEALPREALAWSKLAFMDTTGVMLAGANEECVRIVRELVGAGHGPCYIAGAVQRASCLDAALVNGTAAHALDAKFSVQYCVARALLDGKIVVGQFEGDAFRDPATRALMQRVRSEIHRPGQFAADNHFGAEVAVTLTNGRRFSSRVDIQRGRTVDNPIPPELLRAKFENCAARVLTPDAVARLLAKLDAMEGLGSAHELTRLMAPAVKAAA